jgi:hypothetical protein
MGKLVTLKRMMLACTLILFAYNTQAQVSAYAYSQSSSTFTPLATGTVYGTTATDDQRFVDPATPAGGTTSTGVGLPIGFNFIFNADTFDRIGINANGWISFGKSTLTPSVNIASTSSYYPLPSTSTITPNLLRNRFAGMARDMQARAGSTITMALTGTSPNQVLVVEWLNYKRYSSGSGTNGDTLNFQIRLHETTNVVEVVYGTMKFDATTSHTGNSNSPQIGLGGKTSADYNSRTTTTNWNSSTAATSNAAGLDVATGVVYPATGLSMQWTPPTPCAGTPVAGVTTASGNPVCAGTIVTVSTTGGSTGVTGLTYQWIRSTDGINYTNLPNGTGLTATDTINVAKYFRLIVTCTNSGLADTSAAYLVSLSAPTSCYCTPTYSSGCGSTGGDAITNVVLNNLTNASGCAATPYYTFFNSVTIPDLQQTSTDTVFLTFGSDASQYSGIWIDYNQDGDFGDAGEFVAFTTVSAGASGTSALVFSVPLNATLGQTRMRIRGGNDSQLANTPCGASSSNWGETEDYIVNITAAPPCAPASSLSIDSVSDALAVISWNSLSGNTSTVEYGPAGFTPGTGTLITNATSPVVISGLTPQTDYAVYVVDTCAGPVIAASTGPVGFSTLCSPQPYPGNTYPAAILVNTFPFTDTASTDGPCITDESPLRVGNDLFYRIVADSCASEITFSLCGSDFDTYLYIVDSAASTVLETSDDFCGTASEITFTAEPGTTYIAIVEPYSSSGVTGTVIVNVTQTLVAGPEISTSFVSPSCAGVADGSATVSVDAYGTQPVTYLWSTGGTGATVSNIADGTYYVTVTTGCGTAVDTVVIPALFNVAITSVTNVSCNGGNNGAINVTVNGGVSPFDFAWSNSATSEDLTGLTAGTYTVTVTDNGGCTTSASATVTEPAALSIAETVENISCNGLTDGSVDITVTGGVENIIVDTLTTTFAGGNGCTSGNMFDLQVINNLSITQFDINAFAGTQTVNVYYKTGSYVGSETTPANWTLLYTGTVTGLGNGGPSPVVLPTPFSLTAGNYGFYVEADVDYTNITAGTTYTTSDLVFTVGIGLCAPFDLTNNGRAWNGNIHYTKNQGYSYSWSTGATTQDVTGLGAGAATVTVTDFNNCIVSETYTITQPLPIVPALDSLFDVSCNGLTDGGVYITVGGGTTPYTYLWSNGATTQDLVNVGAGVYTGTITDANGCTFTSPQIPVTEPAVLAATVASYEDVSCNGAADGSIDITVTGGTTPYVYGWSTSSAVEDLTGLGAGTYDLTVTDDNGCSATVSQAITEPALLMLMLDSVVNGLCNGDSHGGVYVSAMGGTTPYTFAWSNSTSNEDLAQVAAGTYTVSLTDASGCTATPLTNTVTEPTALTGVVDSTTNVSCNGGSNGAVYITISGGTGAYTYNWSNQATTEDLTGVGAGTYTGTVTDANGCTVTASQAITEPAAIVVTADSVTNVKCFGATTGGVYISVTGGTGAYTYNWSNQATTQDLTAVGAGSYTGTVTDANGCSVTATAAVTQPAAALSATSTSTDQVQGGTQGSINVTTTGGTTPYTFNWSNNATTEDLSAIAAGNYTLTITDANGCTATLSDTVNLIIGIEELAGGYTLNMYPNPTSAVVTFDVTLPATDNVTVEVYNVTGQAIRRITERDVMQTKVNVNLADEAEGVYLARIIIGNQVITKHVVVSR